MGIKYIKTIKTNKTIGMKMAAQRNKIMRPMLALPRVAVFEILDVESEST